MPTGRAICAKGASALVFEDPEWDSIFDALIRLTTRTSLIIELTGTDTSERQIKKIMDRKFEVFGEKANRPRGVGKDKSCASLLQTTHDRFDASYLVAQHFGPICEERAETETNFKLALQKRIEVFHRYRSECYKGQEPRLSFEVYITLIQGVKERNISVSTCPNCGAQHVYNATSLDIPKCPMCSLLELNMVQADQQLRARLQSQEPRRAHY